jgi:Golgi nucleoside diphosphatase
MNDLQRIVLNAADGRSFTYNVYSRTFLGYGANEARYMYVVSLHFRRRYYEYIKKENTDIKEYNDPCMPKGLKTEEFGLTLMGTGEFEKCTVKMLPILNETAPCPDYPCFFDGVHAPEKDLTMEKWIAVSEYWYTTSTFKLGGPYKYDKLLEKTKEFCDSDWDKAKSLISGESEDRLKSQCFKMAWVMTLLHEGFDLPKDLKNQVDRELLQSKDDIDQKPISWTLGAVLLQLVREKAFMKDSKKEFMLQLVHTWNIDTKSSLSEVNTSLSYVIILLALISLATVYYLYKHDGFKSCRTCILGRSNGVEAWMTNRNQFRPVPLNYGQGDIEMGGLQRSPTNNYATNVPKASTSSSAIATVNVNLARWPLRPQSSTSNIPLASPGSGAFRATNKP